MTTALIIFFFFFFWIKLLDQETLAKALIKSERSCFALLLYRIVGI